MMSVVRWLIRWYRNPHNFVRRVWRWITGKTLCIKPSGTISKIHSQSEGVHPHHDPYYIRRANRQE